MTNIDGTPRIYRRKITQERIETIKRMQADGKTLKQIAAHFGVTDVAIYLNLNPSKRWKSKPA